MKSTGIVRRIDELGRIVLPKELRRVLGINEKDQLEIFVEDKSIILCKYEPSCIFCDESDNTIVFRDKIICKKCLSEIQKEQ